MANKGCSMKNLVVGFLLGILVLKTSYTYYSYEWWSAKSSLACRIERDSDAGIFPCIDRKMGNAKYFGYINMNLDFTDSEWQLRY